MILVENVMPQVLRLKYFSIKKKKKCRAKKYLKTVFKYVKKLYNIPFTIVYRVCSRIIKLQVLYFIGDTLPKHKGWYYFSWAEYVITVFGL